MPFFVACSSCPMNEGSFRHTFGTFQVEVRIFHELDRVYRPFL